MQVPLTADARHDLERCWRPITPATKVVIVCTPNNPTGPAVRRDELRRLSSRRCRRTWSWSSTRPTGSSSPIPTSSTGSSWLRGRDNVVVLRTFSKAYGLAGLRVGYAIAPPPLAEAIRKCALPFGVSQVAQAAAVASLEAEAHLLARVDRTGATSASACVPGCGTQGWTVPDAQGNFVWLALGDRTLEFAAACEARGSQRAAVRRRRRPGEHRRDGGQRHLRGVAGYLPASLIGPGVSGVAA